MHGNYDGLGSRSWRLAYRACLLALGVLYQPSPRGCCDPHLALARSRKQEFDSQTPRPSWSVDCHSRSWLSGLWAHRIRQARLAQSAGYGQFVCRSHEPGGLSLHRDSYRFPDGATQAVSFASLHGRQPAYAVDVFGNRNLLLRISDEPHPGTALLSDRRRSRFAAPDPAGVLSIPLVRRTGDSLWPPPSSDRRPHHYRRWLWAVRAPLRR